MTDSGARRFFLPIIGAAVFLLLAQCLWLYGYTGRDDAFLTYWPAVTLAEHGDILNYNSEPVEQSSTLLHTMTLSALHRLLPSQALPTLAWGVSMAAGALTLLATGLILRRQTVSPLAVIVLASAPSLLFWSSSGMETLTATVLLTTLLLLCLQDGSPRRRDLAILAALIVLCRPEMFLVLICFSVMAWLLTRRQHRQWLLLLVATVASFAAVSWWRHSHFGDWFPQPVSAKRSGISDALVLKGVSYLLQGGGSITTQCITAGGLLAWSIALFWPRHPQRKTILIAGSLALAQIAFVLASGGDWMDATRFLLPVLPALLLCSVLLLSLSPRLLHATTATLIVVALWDSWHFARNESTGFAVTERSAARAKFLPADMDLSAYSATELQTKDALRDIPQLEHLNALIERLHDNPLQKSPLQIASIQMGFIPFHLAQTFPGRLHFLDLRALSTRELTSCAALQDFPRSETGILVSYDQFFALLPDLEKHCGISKPDILYDLGYAMRKDVLERNGYVITWLAKRSVMGEFSQRAVSSELFVAVRRELAVQYGLQDFSGSTVTQAAGQSPPNIVLLLADDIAYDHLGFMGNTAARTPTLDQLAQQGTVFTTAHATSAFCRPSLASLLSGSWPHQNRIYANEGVVSLPPGYTTLATLLHQRGYATFAGGKFWEDEPEWRGFDSFDVNRKSFARENQNALWQFIDQHAGRQPLFIWWAPMLPHTPHNPPQVFLDAIDPQTIDIPSVIATEKREEYRQKTQNLLAMTLWMDDEIRKVREKLAEKNLLDNTLVVYLADNGFSHRSLSKSTPYELGLRTPIVFNWPGHVPTAQRIDAPTSSINLYNTLLDYAGITNLPADRPQPGHSLRAVIEQQVPATPEKLFGADYQAVTMKTDPQPRPERDIFALHVRDGDWKYIFYLRDLREENNNDLTIKSGMQAFPTRNAGDEELYNLATDAYEEQNLANQKEQQQRLADYRRQVLQWWYSTGGKPFDVISTCETAPTALCEKLGKVNGGI